MAAGGEERAAWTPSHNPWLIAVAVMLATFMEVLDTSVANVSLPHIAGNLSATTDEATWVLTSYLVANAVILPATNWLGQLFGRKRFLISCIVLFTIASALCGAAQSLGFLIVSCRAQAAEPFNRFRRRSCSKVFRRRNAVRPWPSSPWE
jgi:DHA2 family multidrug resistance protein